MKSKTFNFCLAVVCLIVATPVTGNIHRTLRRHTQIPKPQPRHLGLMGPSDEELAERQARKDKNILELKMMIAESKKDNEIRGINAKLEELEQHASEIQDTMYAKLQELNNLVSRIRAQRIAGARVQVIPIKP